MLLEVSCFRDCKEGCSCQLFMGPFLQMTPALFSLWMLKWHLNGVITTVYWVTVKCVSDAYIPSVYFAKVLCQSTNCLFSLGAYAVGTLWQFSYFRELWRDLFGLDHWFPWPPLHALVDGDRAKLATCPPVAPHLLTCQSDPFTWVLLYLANQRLP